MEWRNHACFCPPLSVMNNLAVQGPCCRVEMVVMGRLDIYGMAMLYVRLPQPTQSSVPRAALMMCFACINATLLFIGGDYNRRVEMVYLWPPVRAPAAVIGSSVVHYSISQDELEDFMCAFISRSIYVQHRAELRFAGIHKEQS